MKDEIKLSNGTYLQIDGWGYNSVEMRTKDGHFTSKNVSIDFSVWVTRKNGVRFKVEFQEVPISNKDSLIEYANDQLTMAIFLDN